MCKLGQPPAHRRAAGECTKRAARNKARHTTLSSITHQKYPPLIFYLCWAVCDLINVRSVCVCSPGQMGSGELSLCVWPARLPLSVESALISNLSATPTSNPVHVLATRESNMLTVYFAIHTIFSCNVCYLTHNFCSLLLITTVLVSSRKNWL